MELISKRDYDKWESSCRKIVTAPLKFLLFSAVIVTMGKKIQIGKLIANPLVKEEVVNKNQGRSAFLIKHTILFGTIAFATGAYFKKEFNKYFIFKEY